METSRSGTDLAIGLVAVGSSEATNTGRIVGPEKRSGLNVKGEGLETLRSSAS